MTGSMPKASPPRTQACALRSEQCGDKQAAADCYLQPRGLSACHADESRVMLPPDASETHLRAARLALAPLFPLCVEAADVDR